MRLLSVAGSLLPAGILLAAPAIKPPDACRLITLADVTTTLGRGFAKGAANELANGGETSSCLYRKDLKTTVAIAILAGPNNRGKAAVVARQQRYQSGGRSVAPLAGLCDAAFSVVITPSNAFVVAAKGAWEMDVQVVVSGRPNLQAAQTLTKAACGHHP